MRGLLNELGRGNEMSLLFKDLAMNEGGKTGAAAAEEADETG